MGLATARRPEARGPETHTQVALKEKETLVRTKPRGSVLPTNLRGNHQLYPWQGQGKRRGDSG